MGGYVFLYGKFSTVFFVHCFRGDLFAGSVGHSRVLKTYPKKRNHSLQNRRDCAGLLCLDVSQYSKGYVRSCSDYERPSRGFAKRCVFVLSVSLLCGRPLSCLWRLLGCLLRRFRCSRCVRTVPSTSVDCFRIRRQRMGASSYIRVGNSS